MLRVVAVCAVAARAASDPPARPERLLMYASTGGLGNQLAGLRSALALAAGLNRTLVVPPYLEHGALPYGGGCKTAAGEVELAKLALRLYNLSASQNLVDVLDFARGVARFDPTEHARPTLATEYAAARCARWDPSDFRTSPWAPLIGRRERLVMVGSAFKYRPRGPGRGRRAAVKDFSWRRALPLAPAVGGLGRYGCAYVRWPDEGARSVDAVRLRPSAAATYVASEHATEALCAKLTANRSASRCLTQARVRGSSPANASLSGWSAPAASAIFDMYACSRATDSSYCVSYRTHTCGSFYEWIRTLSRRPRAFERGARSGVIGD